MSNLKAGTKDIFAENLPGFPDGVSTGSDSTFWVALAAARNPLLDLVHPYKEIKEFVWMLPQWLRPEDHQIMAVQLDSVNSII